jgi:serine/threonine protein kinase
MEYKLQAQLKDTPGIVRMLGIFDIPGKYQGLVMEAANGGTLHHWISTYNDDPLVFRNIFLSLSRGLLVIHAQGIVIRDIKPDNILLFKGSDNSITAKWSDFGLATRVNEPIFEFSPDINYCTPEMSGQKGPVMFMQDIFALGCSMYEVLSKPGSHVPRLPKQPNMAQGFVNFKSTEFLAFEHSHAGSKWGKVVTLIKNMLNDNPKKRPTIQEVLKVIHEIPSKQ